MIESRWTEADVPDQSGRVALITGANSGIGFETARVLAENGARVLLACRDVTRGRDAIDRIRATASDADISLVTLDLADLSSVRAAATEVLTITDSLHLLINNAGVMALPKQTTTDGFEMQFGTNHLGHFALTGLLIDRLDNSDGARVVNVSSQGHRIGYINFDDLAGDRSYHRWLRYSQSKVANLLFTYELQRRLAGHGSPTIAVACHPGGTDTNLARDAGRLMAFFQPWADTLAQTAAMGALPSLRAAVDPHVRSGDYYGPDGMFQMQGFPIKVHSTKYSHRLDVAAHLWLISEHLTGVEYLD